MQAITVIQAYGVPFQPFDSIDLDTTVQILRKSRVRNFYITVRNYAFGKYIAKVIVEQINYHLLKLQTQYDEPLNSYQMEI